MAEEALTAIDDFFRTHKKKARDGIHSWPYLALLYAVLSAIAGSPVFETNLEARLATRDVVDARRDALVAKVRDKQLEVVEKLGKVDDSVDRILVQQAHTSATMGDILRNLEQSNYERTNSHREAK